MLNRLWPFRKSWPSSSRGDPWDLSRKLLQWSKQDAWTVGDSVTGTFVCGATGSGKSSGSGRAMARAMLAAGYGGLVLTAKPDEAAQWKRYCKQAGRLEDLILVEPGGPWRFNPLDFEVKRSGTGAGLCENVVAMLSSVLELADRGGSGSGGSGREDEGYWRRALKQLIRNLTELHIQATGGVSFDGLYRAVISAPTSLEQVASEQWRESSLCYRLLKMADQRCTTPEARRDLELVADYLLLEYPALSDKTRSVVVSTFTSLIDPLQRSPLRKLFGTDSTFTPDVSEQGKIIVVGTDIKQWGDVGIMANAILKHAWQRSIERRNVTKSPRPVFLWADEAQHFVSSADMLFATTCRSSRVAMVLLTQNISNLHAALGGSERGKAEASSLLGNMNLKIGHANGDPITNEWFASLSGRSRQFFMNGGSSRQTSDWLAMTLGTAQPGQTSSGFSEQMEFEIQPSVFTRLRTGGKGYRGIIDAIMFQNGKQFRSTGKTWMKVEFRQERQ